MRRLSLLRSILVLLTMLAAGSLSSLAAVPNRIHSGIADGIRVAQPNSVSPRLRDAVDQGRLPAATSLTGLSINFLPSAAQQVALDALLQAQQDPSSAQFHKWLTPAQFGAQFGMSDSDLAAISTWLASHGLQVDRVAPSRNAIHFSGTAGQVEQAFQTELHTVSVDGETHFANTTAPSLPGAFAGAVSSVRGLDNFRPRAHTQASTSTVPYRAGGLRVSGASVHPLSVDPSTGTEYVAPEDFAKIYDVTTLYNAGFTGSAAYPIGIIGQTAVQDADLNAFRSAFGLSATLPTYVQVPNTGASTVVDAADLSESELDLEWAGAVAPNVPLFFVYTGNAGCTSNSGCSYGVFDALQYAIQTFTTGGKPLPILSISYGQCEPSDTAANYTTYEGWFQQANAQGQTILTASGDQGAAACDYTVTQANNYAAIKGLQVTYPASSAYVTSVGGTSFSGDLTSNTTYWAATDDANFGNELGLFIPSTTWDDTPTLASMQAQVGPGVTPALSASGGGASTLFAKPSWQLGPGVPADGKRDLPDVALSADPNHDGFLVCINGSCTSTTQNLQPYFNVYGGTSVASPSFAGIMALTEQKLGGFQGNINPSLYVIGTDATQYASAFHDITTGTNDVPCVVTASDVGCTGGSGGYSTMGYSAGAGYDLITGLGVPDAANFAAALGSVAHLSPTASNSTFSPSAPVTGQTVTFTVMVAQIGSGTLTIAPTGTVAFTVDGATVGTTVQLAANGSASFATAFSLGGPHTVAAVYSGDTKYDGSSSLTVVNATALGTVPTITALAVSPATISVGGSITLTATVSTSSTIPLVGSVTFSAGPASALTPIGPIVGIPLAVNGSTGTAVLSYTVAASSLPAGTDTVAANFGGGGAFASSSGTFAVTVTIPSITLSATSFSVASGGSGSSTITVVSGGNYSGTVKFSASTASTLSGSPTFTPVHVTVSPGTPGTSTLTLTGVTASAAVGKGIVPLNKALSSIITLGGFSFAGILFFGSRKPGIRRQKGWMSLLTVLVFAMLAAGMGCSSSSTSSTPTGPTTGTYTITITGTDISNSTITNTANFTVTIQ